MSFCDLLRMTVLLAAGAATVLAAVTAIVVGTTGDTLTLFVALACSGCAEPRATQLLSDDLEPAVTQMTTGRSGGDQAGFRGM